MCPKNKTRRIELVLILLSFLLPSAAFAQEASTYDDPFYKQKGTLDIIEDRHLSPFQQVSESVDPFTGNLNLLHTDVILPGNGSLTFRTRFLDFTGRYVLHCHMMNHEDMGMMQLIEVY